LFIFKVKTFFSANNALCLTPVRLTSAKSSKLYQNNSPFKKIKSQALFKKKVHSTALNGT